MRGGDDTLSLRELIARLIDASKAYARAEIDYLKREAVARIGAAGSGIGFALGALLIAQAALTVLVAAFGLWLARWLGTAGGLAIGALLALALAAMLGWIGFRRISGAAR